MIATGSDVASPPGVSVAFDEKVIVSSTGALELGKVPNKLVVIGAGVIGLELGSVWRRLGAEVTVVEYLDRILPGMDSEVAKSFQRILEKQGVTFQLSSKVTAVEAGKSGASVTFEPVAGGAATVLSGDVVLVATGRRPYTEGLGLEAAGVAMDRGRITIDHHFQTNVPGIFAIGDVVRDRDEEHASVAALLQLNVGDGGGADHQGPVAQGAQGFNGSSCPHAAWLGNGWKKHPLEFSAVGPCLVGFRGGRSEAKVKARRCNPLARLEQEGRHGGRILVEQALRQRVDARDTAADPVLEVFHQ